jgi:hypothetical protein
MSSFCVIQLEGEIKAHVHKEHQKLILSTLIYVRFDKGDMKITHCHVVCATTEEVWIDHLHFVTKNDYNTIAI